jgi:hypothetical protein
MENGKWIIENGKWKIIGAARAEISLLNICREANDNRRRQWKIG